VTRSFALSLIFTGKLFSYDPSTKDNRDVHLKQSIGTVVPLSESLCVVAGIKGVAVVDQTTGESGQPVSQVP
jgi:hypothetical protein